MEAPGGSARPGPGRQSDEVSPATGLSRWVDTPEGQGRLTWERVLGHWELIEADMHEVYGVDIGEPGLLEHRSGRWLRLRIEGLVSTESRLHRELFPPKKAKP
jgi:hypothetical protein